jgi:6-phosphogluconolactonase (cycloisomerase 2 family)
MIKIKEYFHFLPIAFISILLVTGLWISSCGGNISSDASVGRARVQKYVSNASNSNTVLLCGANSQSGLFTSCAPTATDYSFNGPWGIITSNITGTNFAYIADTANNAVVKCNINADSSLSGCANASSTVFSAPTSFAIYKGTSANYMYVANSGTTSSSSALQCTIQSDGRLSSCTNVGSLANTGVAVFGDFFYQVATSSRTIIKCPITPSTGAIGLCATTGSGYTTPISLTFNTTSSGTFAYIAEASSNTILVCSVNSSTGALSTCTSTGSPTGSNFGQPTGVSITGNYAYISDYGTNTIFVCGINPTDGTLSSSCLPTGTGYSGPVASF